MVVPATRKRVFCGSIVFYVLVPLCPYLGGGRVLNRSWTVCLLLEWVSVYDSLSTLLANQM